MKIQFGLAVYSIEDKVLYTGSFSTLRSLFERYKLVRRDGNSYYFSLIIRRAKPSVPMFGVSLSSSSRSRCSECVCITHRVSCWSIIRLKDKVKSIIPLLSYD